MTDTLTKPSTAFLGHRILMSGPIVEVALAVKNALDAKESGTMLTFDDATGRVIDLDLRGSKAEIISRLSQPAPPAPSKASRSPKPEQVKPEQVKSVSRGPGRPKLGVVAREVTLLPRHWEWLASQPGSASVTLRRLVEEARIKGGSTQQRKQSQEVAYRFMSALAGDLPGYEEAIRALFADDRAQFEEHVADWPQDVRDYADKLAFSEAA